MFFTEITFKKENKKDYVHWGRVAFAKTIFVVKGNAVVFLRVVNWTIFFVTDLMSRVVNCDFEFVVFAMSTNDELPKNIW